MAALDLTQSRLAPQERPRNYLGTRKYPGICQHCQQPFFGIRTTQKYCSSRCQNNGYKRLCKSCIHCGTPFRSRGTKRRYCSPACWYDTLTKTAEDFWALVDTSPHPQGCWLWAGFVRLTKMNYGEFKGQLVHRYAYRLYHPDEELTENMLICHTCDNCPCVREEHLFKGTYLDNNRDSKSKGRNARGERTNRTKLTDAQVREILRLWKQGGVTQRDLCCQFALSPPAMSLLINGKTWRHIAREAL
jgi:hypothetical protein